MHGAAGYFEKTVKGAGYRMARQRRPKKKNAFPSLALRVGIFGLCVYLCVSLVFLQVDIVAKRKQLENLEQQAAAQQAVNQELMRLRDDSDEEAYMERIAREKLGYVLPGEHIYVDMSGG